MDNKDYRLSVPYINQSTVTECGDEVTLPDYYPEVKRVVSTLCRVLPESLYDNGETAEQGGVVAFTVLYLGDDGSLAAFPVTCDFSVAVQLPKGGENSTYSFDTSAENVTCRATGPRRLSLKARLRTCITGEKTADCMPIVTDSDGGSATTEEKISVQSFEVTHPSMRRATGRITGTVSGEIKENPGTKPVLCDGEILINEAVAKDGGVTLRGEAVLWCICFGNGLYYKTSMGAKIEEHIPAVGDFANADAAGFGRCASVTVKDSGDGTLLWDMEYDLECMAAENVSTTAVQDMYSTMWQSKTTEDEVQSVSLLKCGNGRLSLSGSGGRSGNINPGDYVIGAFGKATCDRVDKNGTRLTISGTAEVRVPVCGGGEAVEECVRLPFKYECDCPAGEDGEIVWQCDVSVVSADAQLDGGTIRVTAELSFGIFAAVKIPVRFVSGLELMRDGDDAETDCTVRMYYPAEGETAWDIAKKYRIPKNAVAEVSEGGVLIE